MSSKSVASKRQEMERKVVRHLIRTMRAAGWNVHSVFDGELNVKTTTEAEVMDTVFSVDESFINFRKPYTNLNQSMRRMAYIVLGNDGYDCIADHSCSDPMIAGDDFEKVMDEDVFPYAESLPQTYSRS